jgi:hypothetical protein
MKEIKKLRATMSLEQDEMIVLKGGGVVPSCTITKCPACSSCDALSNSGWMRGYDTKSS